MNHIKIEDNKNNIIKKHEILVKNARYKLSELGIKVISILISMVNSKDEDFKEYTLKIEDFKELIGSNSQRTYEYVDALTTELMSKPFKIGNKKFNWVSMSEHVKGSSEVHFTIHPHLKPYLLNLQSNFIQYNIANILRLKSLYIIRLYEMMKDELTSGTRYKAKNEVVFELEVNELRELFNIPESYQYSSGIKKRIIEKAQNEFKLKTDIQFTFEEIKRGQKVDRLLIRVSENKKGSNDYLKSEKAFIAYIRKNFVHATLYEGQTPSGEIQKISVHTDGKLFDKSGKDFDSSRSKEIWERLYSLAKEKKLLIQL